jgi:hypothetical protein
MGDYWGARACIPIEEWHGEKIPTISRNSPFVISCSFPRYEVELTAMKVPGKKSMVRTAMAFMEELSRLLAAAISQESAARSWLDRASFLCDEIVDLTITLSQISCIVGRK